LIRAQSWDLWQNIPVSGETFSIGFEDQTYNELEYARTVSKHFGTKHYEFIIKRTPLIWLNIWSKIWMNPLEISQFFRPI
jgi:hypothetical protein